LILTNVIATAFAVFMFGVKEVPFPLDGVEAELTHLIALRMGVVSLFVGTIFTLIATRVVVKPIKALSVAAKQVADGDFEMTVPSGGGGRDELSELTDNFNVMVQSLRRNEYVHKDFVSNVSHEFKTPIAAIQGYAEMLGTPGLSEEKRLHYAHIVGEQVNRLSNLSNNMLRLAELEHDGVMLTRRTFRLDEQIRDVLVLLQSAWEEKGLVLDIDLPAVTVEADRALLEHVWSNVLGNAIRYSPDGAELKVSMRSSGDGRVCVRVVDSGVGMTSEQQARMFERFYRADTARSNGGTGLGLAIVKRIVDLHGGEVLVTSEIGRGTQVDVVLRGGDL
ncbi:MAG: ATP-binding protein, partial [Bacilli bacterium]